MTENPKMPSEGPRLSTISQEDREYVLAVWRHIEETYGIYMLGLELVTTRVATILEMRDMGHTAKQVAEAIVGGRP